MNHSQQDTATFFSYFPIVALTLHLPIDGAARIFFLYILETLDHAKLSSLVPLPTTLDREGEKIIWILQLNYADGGNRTRAASTASKSAIHYTIASRQDTAMLIYLLCLDGHDWSESALKEAN